MQGGSQPPGQSPGREVAPGSCPTIQSLISLPHDIVCLIRKDEVRHYTDVVAHGPHYMSCKTPASSAGLVVCRLSCLYVSHTHAMHSCCARKIGL